jgi:hypothetical protein
MVLGNIACRAQAYVLADRLAEDKPATPLLRRWSGLMFAVRSIASALASVLFFLPIALGILLLSLAELFYLVYPEFIFWTAGPEAGMGLFLVGAGTLALAGGQYLWDRKLTQLDASSMLLFSVIKLDIYAFRGLAGISAVFFVPSLFRADRILFPCSVISLLSTAGGLLWAWYRSAELIIPKPFLDADRPAKPASSGLSVLPDASSDGDERHSGG